MTAPRGRPDGILAISPEACDDVDRAAYEGYRARLAEWSDGADRPRPSVRGVGSVERPRWIRGHHPHQEPVRVTRIRRFVSSLIRRLWREVRRPRPAAPPLPGAIGAEFKEVLERLARLKGEFHPSAKAFERAVPAIVARFRSEAKDLIEPAIYFDAVGGEIDVIEYVELIGHIPEFLERPRRIPGELATVALAIAGETLTRLDRVPDPRWHPDESPWVATRDPA